MNKKHHHHQQQQQHHHRCRFHLGTLLCIFLSSFTTSHGRIHPAQSLFNNYPSDESNLIDNPIYRMTRLRDLLAERRLSGQILPEVELIPTGNGRMERNSASVRNPHGKSTIQIAEQLIEDGGLLDTGWKLVSPSRNTDVHGVFYNPMLNDDQSKPRPSSGLNLPSSNLDPLMMIRPGPVEQSFGVRDDQLPGSRWKRTDTISIRDGVHPVFLGFGQETTGAALNTLARLLAEEEDRMQRHSPIDRTKESIRFIG